MSSSCRLRILIEGFGMVVEAFESLNTAQQELEKLHAAAYERNGKEKIQWETEIEVVKDAPIKIKKNADHEICIEPVDENNPVAVDTVKKVKQVYSRLKVLHNLKQKGYEKVKEQKLADGSIRLVVQKWQ